MLLSAQLFLLADELREGVWLERIGHVANELAARPGELFLLRQIFKDLLVASDEN